MNRILVTDGNGYFYETKFNRPEITDNQICVQSIMTGVCRSDIDMMQGNFGPLPIHMQGHEGLGKVIEVGKNITDVSIGDLVATRGEPGYADEYNAEYGTYVKVPEAHPRYIIEPVACGINVILQPIMELQKREGPNKRLLILGSGFLAWVVYNAIHLTNLSYDITIVGNSNKNVWGDLLQANYEGQFDVIVDLSNKDDVFKLPIVKDEALVIMGVQKQIITDFSNLLWKACTMVFPSPRSNEFYNAMIMAAQNIKDKHLNVDPFWTIGYDRDYNWKLAFTDSLNRPSGFSRAYIRWN